MRKLSNVGLTALLGGLVLAAFGGRAARAADGATIKGQVVWAGDKIPPRTPLNVNKDQQACLAKGPLTSEDVVVNPANKGLANVFVWITAADGGKPPVPAALAKPKVMQVEMDQPT